VKRGEQTQTTTLVVDQLICFFYRRDFIGLSIRGETTESVIDIKCDFPNIRLL